MQSNPQYPPNMVYTIKYQQMNITIIRLNEDIITNQSTKKLLYPFDKIHKINCSQF